jgi:hypothetical protein
VRESRGEPPDWTSQGSPAGTKGLTPDGSRPGKCGNRGREVPVAVFLPAFEKDVCGALGCREPPVYELHRLEDGEQRTLCEEHARRWVSR